MKKFLYNLFVNWIWQFPQTFLGKIISLRWKKHFKTLIVEERVFIKMLERTHGVKVYFVDWDEKNQHWLWKFISGMGTGARIKLTNLHDEIVIQHEIGHCVLSLILGWLFLPLNGIPSAIGNLIHRTLTDERGWNRYDRHYLYYVKFSWERLADYFGDVNRKEALAGIPRPADAKYPAMENQRTA